MFVFTAKFNRKRAIAIIVGVAVILCAVILIAGMRDRNNSAPAAKAANTAGIKTNDDRVNFLQSFGWKVSEQPIDEQEIVIPKTFSEVYKTYSELQRKQGFELSKYGGLEAKRYTYEIKNYPSGENGVVADIIVYRNTIIAGDIQSMALNGFMHGLNENIKPSNE